MRLFYDPVSISDGQPRCQFNINLVSVREKKFVSQFTSLRKLSRQLTERDGTKFCHLRVVAFSMDWHDHEKMDTRLGASNKNITCLWGHEV